MRASTFVAALLGAVKAVSANNRGAIESPQDIYCVTYLSTYLVPVTNRGTTLPSSKPESHDENVPARESLGLSHTTSLRSTLRGDTSASETISTISGNVQGVLASESTHRSTDGSVQDVPISESSSSHWQQAHTSSLSRTGSESSESIVEAATARLSSSTLPSGSTTAMVTEALPTLVDSTATTEASPTSTDIIQPAGRSVIFLVSISNNEKRAIRRQAKSGFVGNDNPGDCTFATTFTLTDRQLFDGDVPIFYAGEDYKDISGQGAPAEDAITRTFTESGNILAFQNTDLPNGEASFCQDATGRVHIVFTSGPAGCVAVNLVVYDVEQCQDGQLLGFDELTSTAESATGTAPPPTVTSDAISTESTMVAEESLSSQLSSAEFLVSTSNSQSQFQSRSIDPTSQTSDNEAFTTHLSADAEPSTLLNPTTFTVSAPGGSTDSASPSSTIVAPQGLSSVFTSAPSSQVSTGTLDLSDSATTSSGQTKVLATTDLGLDTTTEEETFGAGTTSDTLATSIRENTESTTVDVGTTTKDPALNTNTLSTAQVEGGATTSEGSRTTEAETTVADTTTVVEVATTAESKVTTSTQPEVTASETTTIEAEVTTTTEGETTSVDTATEAEVTTATQPEGTTTTQPEETTSEPTTIEVEVPTTTEPETTTADVTSDAEMTTTTQAIPPAEPQLACTEISTPYTIDGVTFNKVCDADFGYFPLGIDVPTESFSACLKLCAQNSGCDGVVFARNYNKLCSLTAGITIYGSFDGYDVGIVASRGISGN